MSVITIPFDIDGVIVLNTEINLNHDLIINVENECKGTNCRVCNKHISNFYSYDDEKLLRHLSILNYNTYIKITTIRYICYDCDNHPTTTERLDWHNTRSPFTKVFEEYLLFQLVNSTVKDVSIKEDVGYEAVMGVINRYVDTEIDWKILTAISVLGIDEISLKKGHKDYVTIVSGIVNGELKILAVLKDRKKVTVKAFLKKIPKRLRDTVTSICVDMNEGYINAVKEVFGKKRIVVDRFHVSKLYRNQFDKLRKSEFKRLREELSEKEYKELKGSMWILRKEYNKLTAKELKTLKLIFKYSPLLEVAYKLRNKLTDIFEKDICRDKARREINAWMNEVKASGIKCFDKFIKTFSKYKTIILNYFINRQTSGFVEGLNNKIKVIKRRCYGIINKYNLFQRIYLDLEGYTFFS